MTTLTKTAAKLKTRARAGARPLRILDITMFYGVASGGVRTYLDEKMRDFGRRDVDHALVVPGPERGKEVREQSRVYHVEGPVIPFAPGYRLLTSTAALRAIVQEEQPDVIEVGSPFLVPFLVRRVVAGTGIRTVGFYHADLVRTYAEPLVRRRAAAPFRVLARNLARAYVGRVYRRFDATVAASASVAVELRGLGVRRVHDVPLGVDLDTFRPSGPQRDLRSELGVEHGVPVGVYVGRLCAEKRLDVLLGAHRRVPVHLRPHIVFVGEGRDRPELEREAARRARFSLLSYESDREALAAIYRAADFYLAPGPGETFGLSIAEAMATGLPILAVDRGAAPDRVCDGCGLLYQHGDVASCAAAMAAMVRTLSVATKPGRPTPMSAKARRHAERTLAWKRTFDRLLALYEQLLAQPAS